MGKILPSYKQNIFENIVDSITANISQYYAFASNPIVNANDTPAAITNDVYSTDFINDWQMLFGKKISENDIRAVVQYNAWTSNTVYTRYDNTLDIYNANLLPPFYVVVTNEIGSTYDFYKCIDNANGSPSTVAPDQIQPSSFSKSDGYVWRYICSTSSSDFDKFASAGYIPVVANSVIVSGASNYNGIDVVIINNTGSGYNTYHDGIVRGVSNSTLIQIETDASKDNDFYTKSSIYIYNDYATSQIKNITKYVSNTSGNWVYLDAAANTTNITSGLTQYKISPRVMFTSDADATPVAYSVVNTTSNSISNVIIIDTGYGVTWANVAIVSNTSFGAGANLYAIVQPPGGHGFNPITELQMKGIAISFVFANSESNTITTDTIYNKIGLLKNPYALTENGTKGGIFASNTFSQILQGNVSPSQTYTVGSIITGVESGAKGTVVFSNNTTLYLTGDKTFLDGEYVSDGVTPTALSINTLGDVYTKDISPMYVQNINDVARTDAQSESFKLIIQV